VNAPYQNGDDEGFKVGLFFLYTCFWIAVLLVIYEIFFT